MSAVKLPLWIILNDGDFDGMEHGATLEEAARTFYGPDEDLTGIEGFEVTPELRAIWRNNRRRERYAERVREGWRRVRPSLVPAGFPKPEIGMMAWLSLVTESGQYRCPRCSRFCRIEDFAGADHSAAFEVAGYVARVDYAPACWRCRGWKWAPYDSPLTGGPTVG